MSFLLKAAFWLGLVFYVLPPSAPMPPSAGPSSLPSGADMASAVIRGATQLCRDHAETCSRGAGLVTETVQRELIGAAAPAAHDTLTPADREVPFGGVAAPAGTPPLWAPLPQRRRA